MESDNLDWYDIRKYRFGLDKGLDSHALYRFMNYMIEQHSEKAFSSTSSLSLATEELESEHGFYFKSNKPIEWHMFVFAIQIGIWKRLSIAKEKSQEHLDRELNNAFLCLTNIYGFTESISFDIVEAFSMYFRWLHPSERAIAK